MIKKFVFLASTSFALAAVGGITTSQADKCKDAMLELRGACGKQCISSFQSIPNLGACIDVCSESYPTSIKDCSPDCFSVALKMYNQCQSHCKSSFRSHAQNQGRCNYACGAGWAYVYQNCRQSK